MEYISDTSCGAGNWIGHFPEWNKSLAGSAGAAPHRSSVTDAMDDDCSWFMVVIAPNLVVIIGALYNKRVDFQLLLSMSVCTSDIYAWDTGEDFGATSTDSRASSALPPHLR